MLVPDHWAEARLEGKVGGRPRVIRRFGWSDQSLEHAERHARERAEQAMQALQRGEDVAPRDPKVVYGGAHGLPIREQVIARNANVVVTRNGYGARCLNVADVLFADIDFDRQPIEGTDTVPWLLAAAITLWLAFTAPLFIGVIAGIVLARVLWALDRRRRDPRSPRVRRRALRRIEEIAASTRARLLVYETPAGLRVLALHRTFDPTSDETERLLIALRSDPVYARMCKLQACFRARVSPKPWRIGIADHIKPRPGVWPVREERRPERDAWIARYEGIARGYAACHFVIVFGEGKVDPRCEDVQRMHDEMCQSDSELPIA